MKKHEIDALRAMNACDEAVEWAETQPSLARAWRVCHRGDWMLWYAEVVGADHKRLVWVACQCARLALRYVLTGENRPLRAIETAEAWTRGEVGIEVVRRAASADPTAYAAFYASASHAADAASYAADAADAASYAADAATTAAAAAAAAAAADAATAAAAAEAAVYARSATLVRREWPTIKALCGTN